MSGWLARLPERARVSGEPEAWLAPDRPIMLVLDQRRATEACRELLGHEGTQEHVPLFAATPLSPLLEASPWCVRLEADSDAWRVGEALCRERRLGWCCQPSSTVTFSDLVEHLRGLFVWADPQGGQSLINLQDPVALTALLGSAELVMLARMLAPLGELSTPTPQGHWQVWQSIESREAPDTPLRLTPDMEAALKVAPQAWFLAERLGVRLDEVDATCLEGLAMLNRHGITRARHLESLLPYVQRAEWREREESREILGKNQPAWRKVKALRELMGTLQAQDRDTHAWTM
ncbi:DUF4123 domain-containing protein [Halomonas elongata]|uniref:DUF4123 domain protein n=1 Tax=Halomonas elongata (strain ATCC 33173 / DSM 2581 / NBRC 15536 / NCIMB 2198 / 1H9) TaxID=768066 RepID=E1V3Y2_HALED|nr:DUF4123 domain-containing protein [Halomonas elongata]WBF16543.1 DUF4123 domain-containing protein [Halomonas elongata]WPU48984.1 DUF4123 domain-containing protein [Halomonas elongata DSM 2581]CBV42811.1 DUF4123 domain protein [Halomonas elongata DSM 2581]